jgi:2,3-bisphosphoglycerate-independent phosphoglycerate mutase
MLLLLIMDGYGIRKEKKGNAIAMAKKPNLDKIFSRFPYTTLSASGLDVGLPKGLMGNSEVGHLNIGAGRIVYQEITRIDKAIRDGSFFKNEAFLDAIDIAKKNNSKLHLLGLVSDGRVHSSLEHLYALLGLAKANHLKKVYVHAFLDGRDTSPTNGISYIKELKNKLDEYKVGKIATISGRYYAMDRDKRWERVEKAYKVMVYGQGIKNSDPVSAIKESYAKKITDEFVEPTVIDENGIIREGDVAIFFNFRADRARQLVWALTDKNFDKFPRPNNLTIPLVCMTLYDEKLNTKVAFPQLKLKNILGEVLAKNNLNQLRIAETEKYPHVTFFFNGGEEKPFPGEDRILVPSPKVATYDLKPEMSAYEVTDKVLEAIRLKKYEVIILNYANADMVGHTGIIPAAVKAIEVVDQCVGKVAEAVEEVKGVLLVTADHGNAEIMLDPQTQEVFTAHSTDPVPFAMVGLEENIGLKQDGRLADISPTILQILRIEKPTEMEGKSLIL